ncbi:hypothetical protein FJU30_03990 [Affinibrenneria salicis]|uniref:Uncharacterized protein n=2 Tax=Affinibrenneria salicis TaxID=2590031 RepID=A0A5J5G7S6_9GAMM|nr:hypothetical protein FJU30_00775 [Affinibrenneria salicis]KAA9003332.1 hypothetical protein FJU30_03990 [Affinibrenneria salicis]
MKRRMSVWPIAMLFSGCVLAAHTDSLPEDVRSFLDNADTCQHLSGEWDSSLPEERRREIERDVDQYCGAAQRRQPELQKKYKGDKAVEEKLSEYQF